MSGYFARLVQRASGVHQQAAAEPVPATTPGRSEAADPFETAAPSQPTASPSPPLRYSPQAERLPAVSASPEPKDVAALEPVPLAPRPMEPRPAAEPASPSPQPLAPRPAPRIEESPPGIEGRVTEPDETPRTAERQIIEREIRHEVVKLDARAPVPLNPVVPRAEIPKIKPEKAPVQVQEPVTSAERTTPSAVTTTVEVHRPLEPARGGPVAPAAPLNAPPETPRLVIGRMQVDVVPTPPPTLPRPRQNFRARRAAREASPTTRAHFGLGQM